MSHASAWTRASLACLQEKVRGLRTLSVTVTSETAMVRKSNQAFLDPFFDVESDSGLGFGVRARLTAHFAIGNVQLNGGSTSKRKTFLVCNKPFFFKQRHQSQHTVPTRPHKHIFFFLQTTPHTSYCHSQTARESTLTVLTLSLTQSPSRTKAAPAPEARPERQATRETPRE